MFYSSNKMTSNKLLYLQVFLALLFFIEVSEVCSVGEDYYNPDYSQEDLMGDELFQEESKRHVGSARYGGPARTTRDQMDNNFLKSKRFLGSLARQGWFPREFRGFAAPQWDKRHIGSAARGGYMPFQGSRSQFEGSYKRNLGSVLKGKNKGN